MGPSAIVFEFVRPEELRWIEMKHDSDKDRVGFFVRSSRNEARMLGAHDVDLSRAGLEPGRWIPLRLELGDDEVVVRLGKLAPIKFPKTARNHAGILGLMISGRGAGKEPTRFRNLEVQEF